MQSIQISVRRAAILLLLFYLNLEAAPFLSSFVVQGHKSRINGTNRECNITLKKNSGNIDCLSRKELQQLCKEAKICAIGSNVELRKRIKKLGEDSNDTAPKNEISIELTEDQPRNLKEKYGHLHFLSNSQWNEIERFCALLSYWNERVNLISRKDIANIETRHILPSLSLAKVLRIQNDFEVLDVGTGGGIPGIPLAIYYPNAFFTLVDTRRKKIMAVQSMVGSIGLNNVRAIHTSAQQVEGKYDYVVGRAVTRLPVFVSWVRNKLKPNNVLKSKGKYFPKGIVYIRGDFQEGEIDELGTTPSVTNLPDMDRYFKKGERGYQNVISLTTEIVQQLK